jgi:esterase/lipase
MARRRAVANAAPSRIRSVLSPRVLAGALILVLICFIVLGGAAGFFTFRIIMEHNDTENLTPASFLLSSFESLSFTDRGGGEHEGWLFRGLKGAPVIILCPGYDSNRSELLSLGAVLQENHFNVYIFNFRGPKTKHTFSNLGVQQADDLQAAIPVITKQAGVNPHRLGVFGSTTGGYAALVAAESNPMIKAFAVDSVYERPDQMFDTELDRLLGGPSSLFRILAETEFHLLDFRTKLPPVRENLSKLQNLPKLFISGRDTPMLASITEDLYNFAPDPKRLLVLEHSQTSQTSGAEKKEYENQILSFFLQNLPLRMD